LPLVWAAGKSTLLNALLGSMLLPSSNVPETARITRITHTPLAEGQPPRLIYTTATGESREILGEYAIRAPLPGGGAAGSPRPKHQTHQRTAASDRASWRRSAAALLRGVRAQGAPRSSVLYLPATPLRRDKLAALRCILSSGAVR
jgi:hypothetical protein